jgi:hypothetical protein
MEYIGISKGQVFAILSESIENGKVANAEGTKEVIAKVIEENNKKLLEDIQKLIKDGGTVKFV